MASAAAGTSLRGPRYAPPDPTLPKPWRALIDGNTGYLYFWNPETKAVQYDRPTAPPSASSPSAARPPNSEGRARSSDPSEPQAQAGGSRSQNAPPADDRARNDQFEQRTEAAGSCVQNAPFADHKTRSDPLEPRSAAGVNLAQNVPSTNPVSQAANGNCILPEAYRAKHEITIVGNEAPAPFMPGRRST